MKRSHWLIGLSIGCGVVIGNAWAGTPSGTDWCAKFPDATDLERLDSSFKDHFKDFKSAVDASGATTEVSSVVRPKERAYLMHYAYLIAKQGKDPKTVPAMNGVDIDWWHSDMDSSKKAAQEMVDRYKIDHLKVAPALDSNHTKGKAVDMSVSWTGNLTLKKADKTSVTITNTPRDATNADLIAVAKTYAVIYFLEPNKDRNHWSINGH